MASYQRHNRMNEPVYSPPQIWAAESWPQGQPQQQQQAKQPEPERVTTPERRRHEIEYLQSGPPDEYGGLRLGRPGGGAPRQDQFGNQVNTYQADKEVRFTHADRIKVHDTEFGKYGVNDVPYQTPYLRDLNRQIMEKNRRLNADKQREKDLEASILRAGNPFFVNRVKTPPKYNQVEPLHGTISGPEGPRLGPGYAPMRSPSPPLHGALIDGPTPVYPQDGGNYSPRGPFGTTATETTNGNAQPWPQQEVKRAIKPWPSYDNVFTTTIPKAEQYERKSILLEGDNDRPRYNPTGKAHFGLPQTLKFTHHLSKNREAFVPDPMPSQPPTYSKGVESSYQPSIMEQQQQQHRHSHQQYEPVPSMGGNCGNCGNCDQCGGGGGRQNNNNNQMMEMDPAKREQLSVIDQQKRQYLTDLKRAADAKRRREVERYLDEHGSYIDTATLLDHGAVGKPRYVGYNAAFNRIASDVTHPEIIAQPKISRSLNSTIRELYRDDLEKQVVERERRKQLDSMTDVHRAKLHYETEKDIWERGQLEQTQRAVESVIYPSYPSGQRLIGQPDRYNHNTILRG